jgi:hypothetical protein
MATGATAIDTAAAAANSGAAYLSFIAHSLLALEFPEFRRCKRLSSRVTPMEPPSQLADPFDDPAEHGGFPRAPADQPDRGRIGALSP